MENKKLMAPFLNKEIDGIRLEEDGLYLTFKNSKMKIYDDGQSCCEWRYMRTDDDLPYYVGATFHGVEIKNAPDMEDEYEVHEVQFLEIITSKGSFTISTHNEHNGYYGGFWIKVKIEEQKGA